MTNAFVRERGRLGTEHVGSQSVAAGQEKGDSEDHRFPASSFPLFRIRACWLALLSQKNTRKLTPQCLKEEEMSRRAQNFCTKL